MSQQYRKRHLKAFTDRQFFAAIAVFYSHSIELPCRDLIVRMVERKQPIEIRRTIFNAVVSWLQPSRFVPLLLLTLISGWLFNYSQFDMFDRQQLLWHLPIWQANPANQNGD